MQHSRLACLNVYVHHIILRWAVFQCEDLYRNYLQHHSSCIACIGTLSAAVLRSKNLDEWRKIPAIGTVSIGNHVRIGGNVVIEKGTIGTTTIGDFTQIENLVQIGHEAKIGIQCHIVSLVAIAGWAEIGNYVDIYGQSAISNHVKIGDHSILLARS